MTSARFFLVIARFALGAVILVGAAGHAVAADAEIEFRRSEAPRPAERPKTGLGLPSELALAPAAAPPEAAEPRSLRSVGERPEGDRLGRADEDLLARARRAASATAQAEVVVEGRRQYYQAGLVRGLRLAVDAPELGRLDRLEGERLGRRDPEATRRGREEGGSLAVGPARDQAAADVAREFHDLSREPGNVPRPGEPDIPPASPSIPEPQLEDVMRDHPLGSLWGRRNYYATTWGGWTPDMRTLTQQSAWRDAYDPSWQDADRAFERWRRSQQPYWNSLSEPEQSTFREAFVGHLQRIVGLESERFEQAWKEGAGDGWDYGSFAKRELEWRRGYRDGFVEELVDARRESYRDAWKGAYEEAYRAEVAEWQRNPKPELLTIELEDASGDGIFEPGEEVEIMVDAVNYGGAPSGARLRVEGAALAAPIEAEARLPARSRTTIETLPRARVRADAPLRETGEVRASLPPEAEMTVPLRVSRPLGFAGDVELVAADAVAGTLALRVGVENESRRPVAGRVVLESEQEHAGGAVAAEVAKLAPGEARPIDLSLSGLAPLDLLAGRFAYDVVVRRTFDVTDDTRAGVVPALALDLSRDDLVRWTSARAVAGDLDPRARLELAELWRQRLERDWKEAAEGRGNPYKDDLEGGSARTTPGALVDAWKRHRGEARDPELFRAIARELERQTKDLPGLHPFLKRAVRKLLAEVG